MVSGHRRTVGAVFPALTLTLALALSTTPARADAVSAATDLARLGARPAAMGGWHGVGVFGPQGLLAAPPMGDFEHLAFSHTHSLRHFPGGKKNLDQLDADPVNLAVPLNKGNSLLGLTFSLSGELGLDHRNSNGLLKKKRWLRAKARELFYAAIANELATAQTVGLTNTWEQWGDGPMRPQHTRTVGSHVMGVGSGRWRWSFGLRHQNTIAGPKTPRWLWDLGAAYLGNNGWLLAASLLGEGLKPQHLGGGVEKATGPHLRWRAGYGEDLTYGLGVKLGDFFADYATMRGAFPTLSGQSAKTFRDARLLTYGFSF